MNKPIVYGATYSVHVRMARLALAEKQVPYDLVEIDVFAEGGPPTDYLVRHPFGRIPAFEHDGFRLYESGAITRYVDEAFPGPALQPREPRQRARMNQIIGIIDSYAFRPLIWDIFVERVRVPARGGVPDEARIAAALPRAETCLAALDELIGEGPWLAGAALSLADLHLAPIVAYFRLAPEGAALLARHRSLQEWWAAMETRPSMAATAPALRS